MRWPPILLPLIGLLHLEEIISTTWQEPREYESALFAARLAFCSLPRWPQQVADPLFLTESPRPTLIVVWRGVCQS